MTKNHSILKTGDWIKGTGRSGELFIGYIENYDLQGETVNATVVSSDNKIIEGKTIPILSTQVKKIPEVNIKNKEQLQNLIDLALRTGDEEWFLELTSKLNAMRELVQGAK